MSVPRQKLAAGKAWLRRAGGVLGFPIQMGGPTSSFCKNCHWKWTRTMFQRHWILPVAWLSMLLLHSLV